MVCDKVVCVWCVWVCVKVLYVKFLCVKLFVKLLCVKVSYVKLLYVKFVCVKLFVKLLCVKVSYVKLLYVVSYVKLLYVKFVCVVIVCERWYVGGGGRRRRRRRSPGYRIKNKNPWTWLRAGPLRKPYFGTRYFARWQVQKTERPNQ